MSVDKISKQLTEIIKTANNKETQPYDTPAEVVRIEGDTAWVHIAGGIDETPVKRTISCKVGDSVQVRVSGGSAFIQGNATAPPTDDTTAYIAKDTADKAEETAKVAQGMAEDVYDIAETASTNAGVAITLAEGIDDHFWSDSAGAHITEDTQEDYQQDPSAAGGNTLITSQGMAIRQGTTQLAAFTGSGIQIGQTNEAHTIIAADATEWYTGALTKAGDVEYGETVKTVVLDSVVLSFSDDVFASYVATVTDTAPKTYKITTSGTLTYNSEDPDNIGDFALEETVEFTGLNYNSQGNYYIKTFVFPVVLSSGYTQNYYIIARGTSETDITRVYAGFQRYTQVQAQDIKFKYACNLTIESGDTIHGPRVTFGEADPDDKIAAATNIHNKLRIGDYGEIDASNEYMLIAGNGTDDNNRSNALTVDWQGNVEAAGGVTAAEDITAGGTIDANEYTVDGDPLFKTATFTATPSVPASGWYTTGSISFTVPAGYTALPGVVVQNSGYITLYQNGWEQGATSAAFRAYNRSSSAVQTTYTARVTFVKSELL